MMLFSRSGDYHRDSVRSGNVRNTVRIICLQRLEECHLLLKCMQSYFLWTFMVWHQENKLTCRWYSPETLQNRKVNISSGVVASL